MAFWMRLRSPPGSITAARFVASHHSKVQFCWKGVTGIIAARALCIRKTSSPKALPDLEPIDPEHKRMGSSNVNIDFVQRLPMPSNRARGRHARFDQRALRAIHREERSPSTKAGRHLPRLLRQASAAFEVGRY